MRLVTYSKSVKEAATYRRGWSRIWGPLIKGGIYLIPSETTKIVVQTLPDIKISCILAAKKRRLQVTYDKQSLVEIEVNTPPLLLMQVMHQKSYHCEEIKCIYCKGHDDICFCEPCLKYKRSYHIPDPVTPFFLYELMVGKKYTLDSNIFYMRPYRMGNVDPGATICIGRQNLTPTLRQANFNFWNSSFNNDYPEVYKEHDTLDCRNKHGNWLPHTPDVKGYLRCDRLRPHPSCSAETCNCGCQCVCCRKLCGCHCSCDLNEVFAKKIQGYPASSVVIPSVANGVSAVCGVEFMASSKHTDGVFISYDAELISAIPLAARSNTRKGVAVIGLALLTKHNEWRIDFKAGHSITFTDKEVYLV